MTGGTGPRHGGAQDAQDQTSADQATQRFAAIMRYPKKAALLSGLAFLVSVFALLFLLEEKPAMLVVAAVISAVIFALTLWNIVNYSATKLNRLKELAPRVGGRFTLWKAGTGGYTGGPFAVGTEHERFGMLNYSAHSMQIEIGHLASEVSAQYKSPTARRHAYIAIRLPERLPHMILSFGHLSRVFGVRVAPDQWHRSQRMDDVGLPRRARLFVSDGGEQLARAFLTPQMVGLLTRVGRYYDIEIKDRTFYLFASRSVTAGSERRWHEQRALIEELAAALAGSGVWALVRRLRHTYTELRADVARTVVTVVGVAVLVIIVVSFIVLNAAGLL